MLYCAMIANGRTAQTCMLFRRSITMMTVDGRSTEHSELVDLVASVQCACQTRRCFVSAIVVESVYVFTVKNARTMKSSADVSKCVTE